MDLVAGWMQALFAGWLNMALAAAVGVAMLQTAVSSTASSVRLAGMARRACVLLGIGLAAYLCAGTVAMTETRITGLPAALWLVLTQSHFGAMIWVALTAWIMLMVATVSSAWQIRDGLFVVGLMGFALARAATGHAADQGFVSFSVLIHTAHVLAATAWAGSVGICLLLTSDWSNWQLQQRSALAHRLSEVATLALLVVVGSGLFNAVRTLGHVSNPWGSAYVWILLAKLCAVAIAAGLGARNRWYWLARLDRDQVVGAKGFRLVLLVEAVVLLVVLALAAKLGTTMPA
ncbi:copper resistance D family protein [Polaromonas jejuensis]|uniref:Copper resistance D family protein n=2 Tax=Polaromonas jejuensis TaxID=457502 RepID=A0ABW0Q7U8_9BURK|nr:CopD family protein [Polaromonas jejuensis]